MGSSPGACCTWYGLAAHWINYMPVHPNFLSSINSSWKQIMYLMGSILWDFFFAINFIEQQDRNFWVLLPGWHGQTSLFKFHCDICKKTCLLFQKWNLMSWDSWIDRDGNKESESLTKRKSQFNPRKRSLFVGKGNAGLRNAKWYSHKFSRLYV